MLVNGQPRTILYVIVDILLNHGARVFDYMRPEGVVASFFDRGMMEGPLGTR